MSTSPSNILDVTKSQKYEMSQNLQNFGTTFGMHDISGNISIDHVAFSKKNLLRSLKDGKKKSPTSFPGGLIKICREVNKLVRGFNFFDQKVKKIGQG